jgi:hypothetical protein
MAARNGHLELCRFLLQTTSHFHDNAILSSALNKGLKYMFWADRRPHYVERMDSFLEALYDLFVKENNLEIDLTNTSISRASAWWHVFHTKTSFKVVVASQPTPFIELPLAQQFNAAIESIGWHADAFSAMLHRHATELVTMATDHGMTALH